MRPSRRVVLAAAALVLGGACAPDVGGGARGDAGTGGDAGAGADARPAGDARPDALGLPDVDRSSPRLHSFDFTAEDADPAATQALGTQIAVLDTRVAPRGTLVVYLHGAGAIGPASTCGSRELAELLGGWGHHALTICYRSDYLPIENCGDDIGACRLEAFDGVDHHPAIAITPPNAIEPRVVAALRHLMATHPGGDWGYYLDGDVPRWSRIMISGISHGASSSAVIGHARAVARVISLSGPYDVDQPWLAEASLTPADRFHGFSHTGDGQHDGHLAAFATLGLPGAPTTVDGATPPFGSSHRLISSAATSNGHGAVQPGGSSPRNDDGSYVYLPVWQHLYGAD